MCVVSKDSNYILQQSATLVYSFSGQHSLSSEKDKLKRLVASLWRLRRYPITLPCIGNFHDLNVLQTIVTGVGNRTLLVEPGGNSLHPPKYHWHHLQNSNIVKVKVRNV